MKLALIGYGKMNKAIKQIATNYHSEVDLILNSKSSEKSWREIEKVDVCVDFSHPNCFLENFHKIALYKKPIVVGTTGWNNHLEQVKELVEKNKMGFIYASNFALGMNLFFQIVEYAAKLIDPFEEFDVLIDETHHKHKVDAPSGTAITLAEKILAKMKRINEWKKLNKLNEKTVLGVKSQREGEVFGVHNVLFTSSQETITLTHQGHSRDIWAKGAIAAAQWIKNKKGFYTLKDMLENLYVTT